MWKVESKQSKAKEEEIKEQKNIRQVRNERDRSLLDQNGLICLINYEFSDSVLTGSYKRGSGERSFIRSINSIAVL